MAPDPHAGEQDLAELPELKKKEEKERKGGAIILSPGAGGSQGGFLYRLFGLGGQSGGGLAAGRAAVGVGRVAAGAASEGGLAGLLNFFGSNAGLAVLTALLSGAAVFGLYAIRKGGDAAPPAGGLAFPASQEPTSDSSATYDAGPNSLGLFASANHGKVGGGQAPAAGGADEGKPVDAPKPEIPTPNADAVAEAAKAAAAGQAGQEKPKMVAAAGFGGRGGGQLAGGAGMSGGFGRTFDKVAPRTSALQPFSKPITDKGAASKRAMTTIRQSNARQQLSLVNRRSQAARSDATAEGRSSGSTGAFEGGMSLGNAGKPPAGNQLGATDQAPGANAFDGGPILGQAEEPQAPAVTKSEDKSPWTGALMMGVALLMTASTIILIEGIVAQIAKIIIPLEPVAQMLAAMAAALAASAAAIGAMIMAQYGQMQQGLVLTIGGSITAAAAIAALIVPPEAAPITLVIGGIAGLVASMLGMIMGMQGNKV